MQRGLCLLTVSAETTLQEPFESAAEFLAVAINHWVERAVCVSNPVKRFECFWRHACRTKHLEQSDINHS